MMDGFIICVEVVVLAGFVAVIISNIVTASRLGCVVFELEKLNKKSSQILSANKELLKSLRPETLVPCENPLTSAPQTDVQIPLTEKIFDKPAPFTDEVSLLEYQFKTEPPPEPSIIDIAPLAAPPVPESRTCAPFEFESINIPPGPQKEINPEPLNIPDSAAKVQAETPAADISANPERPLHPKLEPTYLQTVWARAWSWMIYGREHISETDSKESLIAVTWLTRAAVLLLLLALGYLVKVTKLDTLLTSPEFRTLFAAAAGAGLFIGGKRLIKGDYSIIAQGLCGSGLAALYFALYSTVAYELLKPCFGNQPVWVFGLPLLLLMGINLFGGWQAVKEDSPFFALTALAGGLTAPFFIPPEWSLVYLPLLLSGLLFIAPYKRWAVLQTAALAGLAAVFNLKLYPRCLDDVAPAVSMLCFCGTMLLLVPLLSRMRTRYFATSLEILIWVLSIGFTVVETVLILKRFVDNPYINAAVPLGFCLMSLIYAVASLRTKDSQFIDKPLQSASLCVASALAATAPALAFGSDWWGMCWGILAVTLLYLSYKMNSAVLRFAAMIGFSICGLHLLVAGFPGMTLDLIHTTRETFFSDLLEHLFSVGFPLLSLMSITYLEDHPPRRISEAFTMPEKGFLSLIASKCGRIIMIIVLSGFFIALNLQAVFGFKIFYSPAVLPSMTALWVLFAVLLIRLVKVPLTIIFYPALFLLGMKFIFFDLPEWDISYSMIMHSHAEFGLDTYTRYLIPRLADFALLTFFFIFIQREIRKFTGPEVQNMRILCTLGLTALLWLWTTAETATLLNFYIPEIRALGVSVLWSGFAIFFVWRGLCANKRTFRIMGLVFFGGITLKILLHDLWNDAGILRVAALVILVLLYITAAVLYIRHSRRRNSAG